MSNDENLDRWGTQADVGKAAGISQQAVSNWIKRGIVKPRKSDGKYHVGKSVAAIHAARDPDRVLIGDLANGKTADGEVAADAPKGNGATISPQNLLRARTASAVLATQKQQIELAKLKGELISKTDAEAAIRTAQTVVIERLEGLPGLLAARVMQATSVPAAEAIIREAIRSVREELARLGSEVGNAG